MSGLVSDVRNEKCYNSYNFLHVQVFRKTYSTSHRCSKFALLHRFKERKTLSLYDFSLFPFVSLKVVWSGKSLIVN